jgi:hypothetical protein
MSKQKPISKASAKASVNVAVPSVPSVKAPIKVDVRSKPIVKPLAKPVVKRVIKPVAKSVAKPSPKLFVKSGLDKIITPVEKETVVKKDFKKKKLVEITPEHETYFVYLKQPLEYRRHLLESSRKVLFCLRNHQKIILIRQRKLEEMNKLKASVRELLYLNKQFNEKLPKYNTGFLEDTPSKDKSKSVNVKSAAARRPADVRSERTEMDKLEESLANIERKLKTLQ